MRSLGHYENSGICSNSSRTIQHYHTSSNIEFPKIKWRTSSAILRTAAFLGCEILTSQASRWFAHQPGFHTSASSWKGRNQRVPAMVMDAMGEASIFQMWNDVYSSWNLIIGFDHICGAMGLLWHMMQMMFTAYVVTHHAESIRSHRFIQIHWLVRSKSLGIVGEVCRKVLQLLRCFFPLRAPFTWLCGYDCTICHHLICH